MSKIKLNAASGGGSVSLEAPTSTTGNANVEFKLPVADGSSGQALTTNASGQLAFASVAGGKIGQVLSTAKTDTFSRNSSSFGDVTGISVDITPAATTSKVLVLVDLKVGCEHGDGDFHFRLVRDSTVIYARSTADNRKNGFAGVSKFALDNADGQSTMEVVNAIFLDSPSTTSATTYKVQVANVSGRLVYINRQGLDSNAVNIPRGASSITVMEVLA